MADRLADAVSPYLLQHRANPVDWWEWGDAAFEEAARRDVPVFLSIGYATCHWCHVIAHESFEDEEAASALNEAFVCIKVDREERPDVDAAYMAVCQAMTGSGGWPLTVLLAPDKRPFFAGTYLPKRGRGGRMGLLELTARVTTLWQQQRDALLQQADEVLGHLADRRGDGPGPSWGWIDDAVGRLKEREDPEHGGIGTAPKFPSPHQYRLLLRHHARTGDDDALGVVLRALDAMDRGGVHDHVGRGFHRYSTDAAWHLPHFEKMLYDQATLLFAYTEAHQVTGDPRWAGVADDIATYLLQDLRDPTGAFHSAEDADADGEEGVYHSWTLAEIHQVLGPDADAFCGAYGIRPEGNFHDEATRRPTGRNLLHRTGPHDPRFEDALGRLREVRSGRVPPMRDDKLLTDWNGLAIAALARAGAVFGRTDRTDAAAEAARFLLRHHRGPDGSLRHRSRGGRVDDRAFLDDHAFLAWGLLELWQATQDPLWLEAARDLMDRALDRFGAEDGGFWSDAGDEALPVRRRDAYDGAIPSGNSVAVQVLARLARATADPRYEDAAWRTVRAFAAEVQQHPQAFTDLLWGVEILLTGGVEVVVAGDGPQAETLWDAARSGYLPGGLLIRRTDANAAALPWLEEYTEGAYVCRDRACQAPVHDVAALRDALQASRLA